MSTRNQIVSFIVNRILCPSIIGGMMGSLAAFFLWSLERVTIMQTGHKWLVFFLPIGGAIVSWLYQKYGKGAVGGNNLVIERANGGEESIPVQLIPLTLFGTLTTHLFGGSAGREGTAVQMGGTVAEVVGKIGRVTAMDRKILIICGISSGFSSVFGTPVAGTIFALEVLQLGVIRHEVLFSSCISAFVGNFVASLLGAKHTEYSMEIIPDATLLLVTKLIFVAIVFGLVGYLFAWSNKKVKEIYSRRWHSLVLKAFFGGVIVVGVTLCIGSRDYNGLSLPLLNQAFLGNVLPIAFALKFLLTVLTLGAGFQGGEVTPLFVIGACLGSTLSQLLGVPTAFLTALGFIGVFSGATNTPIACFIMGIELFGSSGLPYIFIICAVGFVFSGNLSIYSAQKSI